MNGADISRGVRLKTFFISARWMAILAVLAVLLVSSGSYANRGGSSGRKIPVIFDTDICDDIDDTWALAMILQSPEFDIKLITTAVGNTSSKTKTIAKFLQAAGRTDIPIGAGVQQHKGNHRQDAWAKDYDLSSYPGKIYEDGVQAMIDIINKSRRPIKVVAVGPLPNIAAALEREPKIAQKAEFVGMHGSVRRGYGNNPKPSAEYNVKAFVTEAQKVFAAPWEMTITPLDTCGIIQLKKQKYQKVLKNNSPVTNALMENYRAWQKQGLRGRNKDLSEAELNKRVDQKCNSSSSTLFDTVAIYLAMSTDLVKMEKLPIIVTDDGHTKIDENGKKINCATEWKDLGAFEDLLVDILIR
ncbi:MAG: nucleoside hydrolase [Planctomycetota bacterium]